MWRFSEIRTDERILHHQDVTVLPSNNIIRALSFRLDNFSHHFYNPKRTSTEGIIIPEIGFKRGLSSITRTVSYHLTTYIFHI